MNRFLKRVGVFVVGNLIVYGVLMAIENKMNGKDLFGRDIPENRKTKVDWKGNIVMGTDDYMVF